MTTNKWTTSVLRTKRNGKKNEAISIAISYYSFFIGEKIKKISWRCYDSRNMILPFLFHWRKNACVLIWVVKYEMCEKTPHEEEMLNRLTHLLRIWLNLSLETKINKLDGFKSQSGLEIHSQKILSVISLLSPV